MSRKELKKLWLFFKPFSIIKSMLFSYFYNFIFFIFSLFLSFKVLYLRFVKKKYKSSSKERFGFDFPTIEKNEKPLIWLHAVSVGETRALINLCKLLAPHYTLLISSVTETGKREALVSIPFADYHVYLPIDFGFIIQPIVKKVKPAIVIVSETDLWYQFLKCAKDVGAKTILVNGKISEKSTKIFSLFPFFSRRLFSLVDLFLLQNELYKERFLSLGADLKRLVVVGNLKYDETTTALSKEQLTSLKKRLGIKEGDFVIVVGSTHEKEEIPILKAILKAFDNKGREEIKIILVPRHPERFDSVEKDLLQSEISFSRYSSGIDGLKKVVLLDVMGLLRQCYQLADCAIVAGSFVPNIGGHNILEPLQFGVPVIFGPFMENQPDLVRLVVEARAGLQISLDRLPIILGALLENNEEREQMGSAGLKLLEDLKGVTKKTFDICEKFISLDIK